MTTPLRFAAQYIRMSTDKQDLSPSVQKQAIAAYAAARNVEIVASYEDEGRSGVHLKNRPALLKLLGDVTASKQFSAVLVYDVSRWGRFQDTDAAAYYEYHCRLHGAEVIYVAELFGAEPNPIAAMLKGMKRAMAAEYSRELASKCRAGQHVVIMRGFQIGALPPLGYRRCSVSADGQRRTVLDRGQRKLAVTDRIEWVLAPQAEVELVRRICHMYAVDGLSFTDIARLGRVEGWRAHDGGRITNRSIATLVRNEALIGNFAWGRRKSRRSIVACSPSRLEDCVPRIIDDATWARMQSRIAFEIEKRHIEGELVEKLRSALDKDPLLTMRDLRAHGLPGRHALRSRLGPWATCLERAGRSSAAHQGALLERARQHRDHAREFGHAMAHALRENGHRVFFGGAPLRPGLC